MNEENLNGIKIQKLPTYGRPLSLKTSRQMGAYRELAVSEKEKKKLRQIQAILKGKK